MTTSDTKNDKLGKFHRVQTSSGRVRTGTFITKNSGSGKITVTLSRDSYNSAKNAANRVMNQKKQSA